jgi:hypothetical protein
MCADKLSEFLLNEDRKVGSMMVVTCAHPHALCAEGKDIA